MRPLSNFATRDVEALLHPTTNLAGAPQRWVRWCWSAARACTSTTPPASATSRAWRGCGARGSATATPSWSRRRASRCRGCPSRTCSAAAATSRPSRWPRRSRRMAPCPTSKVFFTNSGSEANDTQIKIAWYYNNARGQPKTQEDHLAPTRLPRHHHRHRQPVGPARVPRRLRPADGARPAHRLPALRQVRRAGRERGGVREPARRAASRTMIEREGPETIAAFIAEPVMGAGGVLIPPRTYFEKVQAVLARHDIAFIADEVICGFAPHGQLVGLGDLRHRARPPSPWPRRSPRPTCRWARSPCSEEVYQALVEESGKHGVFAHGFTYSGHPLACAVALKTIEIYERIDIVAARAARGADLPAAAEGAGGSSAGRRGARRRPDRRAGADARQAQPSRASRPSSASAPRRRASPRRRA